MYPLILKGSKFAKEEYIQQFIKTNNIAKYNIAQFDEPLKISEVRAIKKNLSVHSPALRLVIIKSIPTQEAQNALLKTLEEISDNIQFIFIHDEELLPTIESRSLIKNLNVEDKSFSANFKITNNWQENLLQVDKFFSEGHEDAIVGIVKSLRRNILDGIKNNYDISKLHKILREIIDKNRLIKTNNLNPKITIERILLNNI